jgi:cation:H+ antiporter
MLLPAAVLIAGLVALFIGAQWLVRGASRLATSVGVSALVVGLTVVAFGTSTPELMVSVMAAAKGQSDVSVGNIVGSNIANIGLILGLTALISPVKVRAQLVRRDIPFMILVAFALLAFSLDGTLSRLDGALLLAGFIGYLGRTLRRTSPPSPETEAEYAAFEAETGLTERPPRRIADIGLVSVGLLTLLVAAHAVVQSAVILARGSGVPELIIGLTIIAIGTSLPELATSLTAGVRHEGDIAAGNVVGSNIFNILGVLGIAALLHPLSVNPAVLRFDGPIMLGLSLLVLPFAWSGRRFARIEGAVLLASYVVFAALLVVRARNG